MAKKIRKPDWKFYVVLVVSFVLFSLLFSNWDEVKTFLAGLFS